MPVKHYLSSGEVAEILGLSRQRVWQLWQTHPSFPQPVAYSRTGSLWEPAAVLAFRKIVRSPGPKVKS